MKTLACTLGLVLSLAACGGKDEAPPATPNTTSAAAAPAPEVAAPAPAPAPVVAAPAPVEPAAPATPAPNAPECRAKSGSVELKLTWTNDTAKGTLTVDGKSQNVVALLYKGLVLVDKDGTKDIKGKLATVTTEGKKTIRLGDSKQPTLDCN